MDSKFFGSAAADDGAVYFGTRTNQMLMANCIASGNMAPDKGGVIYGESASTTTVANCSFFGNSAVYGGACYATGSGTDLQLDNSIVWSNAATYGAQASVENSASISIGNCILEGGLGTIYSTASLIDNGDNLTSDPNFYDADGADDVVGTVDDDLSISTNSPALDAGNNAAVLAGIVTDLIGKPRFVDGDLDGTNTVDIGAYEYYIPYIDPNDTDGDGLLDSWEQQIIDADPYDELNMLEDVNPDDDYDTDGLDNEGEYYYQTDPFDADTDGDTLSDGAEANTYYSNPRSANGDGDIFDDATEVAHSMNPNGNDSALYDYVMDHLRNSPSAMATAGLYTEDSIRNLYFGAPLLKVDLQAQEVAINVHLDWNDNLLSTNWQSFDPYSSDWTWTRTEEGWIHHDIGDHCFYRVFINDYLNE